MTAIAHATPEFLHEEFNKLWDRVGQEPEFGPWLGNPPEFIAHPLMDFGDAYAYYAPSEHTVSICFPIYSTYADINSQRELDEILHVLAHELTHVIFHDHSSGFYELLSRYDTLRHYFVDDNKVNEEQEAFLREQEDFESGVSEYDIW